MPQLPGEQLHQEALLVVGGGGEQPAQLGGPPLHRAGPGGRGEPVQCRVDLGGGQRRRVGRGHVESGEAAPADTQAALSGLADEEADDDREFPRVRRGGQQLGQQPCLGLPGADGGHCTGGGDDVGEQQHHAAILPVGQQRSDRPPSIGPTPWTASTAFTAMVSHLA